MGEGTPHEISIFRFFINLDFAYFGNLGLSPSFWAFNFASNAPIESSVAYIQPCFRAFLYFTLIFKLFMGGSTPHEFDWEALLLHGVGYLI